MLKLLMTVVMLLPVDVEPELTPQPSVVGLGLDNPEVEVISPREGGLFFGFFLVELKNISYRPELATNPVTEFAVGVDANNDELLQNDGHIHGWVFRVDRRGNIIRDDAGRPTPASYVRFYGAGGAEFFPTKTGGFYFKPDDLERGRYRAYFQAQQNDHTAMRQATAPAFPAIASVDFWVW